MTLIIRALLLVTLSAVVPHAALAQVASEWVNVYEAKVRNGLSYRLMSPVGFDDNQHYPVIVSLHGAGGRGTDNRKQLKQWNQQLAGEQIRKDYPCYVLAPQSTGLWDETHLRMIQAVIAELPAVDKDRIYMMGHSMGGHGSNILIQLAPKYFAAIAPSAGTGLKRTEEFIDPSKMKDVPIWAFHGDQDKVCPYDRNLKLFNELKELGGNMKLTTFKGDGHGIAGKMIPGADNGNTLMTGERCDPEPDLLKWLFAQRLSGKQAAAEEERTEVPSDFLKFNHGEVDRRYLIYRPKDLPDNAPLVFFLHGYRGDARGYMELGMNRVAETNGFAVCYPQGEKDRKGIPHWNARLKISKVDDIGFLSALAVHLQSTYKLDPKKTFACGISNSGFMSYTLVGWSVYNRVLRKKLIGLFYGDCGGRQIEYVVVVVVFRIEYFLVIKVITLNSKKKHSSCRTTTTASPQPLTEPCSSIPLLHFLLLEFFYSFADRFSLSLKRKFILRIN
ncbi:prolyl oligopeptidase family serine peptidase [bacterium]|nr:prolyl oligopeptidase family serine peptidase [bacterium]